MLVRFRCENIYSFGNDFEMKMFKSKTRNLPEHVFKSKGQKNPDILKSAVIYGANAAGKTNFLKAIEWSRDFVLKGASNKTWIDIPQNKLISEKDSSTAFEYIIYTKEKFYIYGYSLTKEAVQEEWLYEMKNKKLKLMFERKNSYDYEYGAVISKIDVKNREMVENITSDNQLYMNTIAKNKMKSFNDDLANVVEWFYRLNFIFPNTKYGNLTSLIDDDDFKDDFKDYMLKLGININSFKEKKTTFEDSNFPDKLVKILKNRIEKKGRIFVRSEDNMYSLAFEKGELQLTKLITTHLDVNNDEVIFDICDESEGTKRLFDLVPLLTELKQNDGVYFIDELDQSFHTLLAKKFLELFFSSTLNRESQLIFTTHNTNLMDLSLFRDDEIWYMTFNSGTKSSRIHNLYEFKERYDKVLVKDYLDGRYGGIPIFK